MEEPIPDSQPNNAMVDTNNKDDQATRSEAEHSTQESPSKAAEETVPDSQPSIDIVDTNNNEFGLVSSTLFCIFFSFRFIILDKCAISFTQKKLVKRYFMKEGAKPIEF